MNDEGDILVRKYGETIYNTITSVAAVAIDYPKGKTCGIVANPSSLSRTLFLPAEMIKDSARPSYWVPDAESPHCFICKSVFGHAKELELELARKASSSKVSSSSSNNSSSSAASKSSSPLALGTPIVDVRRHHCRRCGQAVCSACSKIRMPVPERGWLTDVRVCDSCACVPRASCGNNAGGVGNSISNAISDAINGEDDADERHSQHLDDNRRHSSSNNSNGNSNSNCNDYRNGNASVAHGNNVNGNGNCNVSDDVKAKSE